MSWERFWMMLAAALLFAAAVFLWRNNLSAAFVTAALGACAWFLSFRAQLKQITRDEQKKHDELSANNEQD